MTVVATIITRHCTAHATDSFLTSIGPDGRATIESQASKMVRVGGYRGAISYWGLAQYGAWRTWDWLKQVSSLTHADSPAAFAIWLGQELNRELGGRAMAAKHRGLGLHFSAYEYVNDKWIPELFQITNFLDTTYGTLDPTGFRVFRETIGKVEIFPSEPDDAAVKRRRLEFHSKLHTEPIMIRYCNGEPGLFMPLAEATLGAFLQLRGCGVLRDPDSTATHRAIITRPVKLLSRLIGDFVKDEHQHVGGKPHNLSITPAGVFESDTGD